ncbi:MAG TPA: site-specific integrase [Thermoplasmata archaeon]|nr:site-specific integrase [Thermoplasmata archaeon]
MARFERSQKKQERLADPDLSRWYHNVARGAQVTADVYLRRLGAFCEQMGVTPKDLAELPEPKVRDVLLDFVTVEEEKRHAGSYIRSTLKAVKSWLTHNGKTLTVPVHVRGGEDTPTLRNEQVPTPEEIHRVLLNARLPRDRVAVLLMAHAGFRPEVLGNYHGSDGLRLGDLPELEIRGKRAHFSRVPAMIRVRPELSKNSHGYLSWASAELCGYIEAYLGERLAHHEKLALDSDLIHPEKTDKRFLTSINVGDVIRGSVRRARFSWRPYVLRAYFDTQMLLAESRGKIAHDYRVYWMGHKGSMDARYTTNKGRIPKELLEDMRAAYSRAEPFLSTEASKGAPTEETLRVIVSGLLKSKGHDDKKVAEVLEGKITGEELEKLLKSGSTPKPEEHAFQTDEVPDLLRAGWTFVAPLNGSMAVLRAPTA